jgi:hypothetical protein
MLILILSFMEDDHDDEPEKELSKCLNPPSFSTPAPFTAR